MVSNRIFSGLGFPMLFEESIRSILGDRALQIADQAEDQGCRKHWYRKVLRKTVRMMKNIESNTTHERALAHWSELALDSLNHRRFNEVAFTNCILGVMGAMLGFVGLKGYCITTPVYFQTKNQRFADSLIAYGVDTSYWDELNSSESIRKRLIGQLKDEGKTYYEIALVMNITEYKVKKYVKETGNE